MHHPMVSQRENQGRLIEKDLKKYVPKDKIFPLANVLNPSKKTPIMEKEKWMLKTPLGKKVYVSKVEEPNKRMSKTYPNRNKKKYRNWFDKDETFIFC